jgi:hypothetical protein
MKTITEQLSEDALKSHNFGQHDLAEDVFNDGFEKAYNLASEHWAAFTEWVDCNSLTRLTEYGDAKWYSNKSGYVGDLEVPRTTTELFQYWFNNVKDKG